MKPIEYQRLGEKMYRERLDDEFDPNTDITRYKLNLWRERRD